MDPLAVRNLLRESLFTDILGILIVAIGAAAAAVATRQRAGPETPLLCFAALSILYGIRMALMTPAAQLVLGVSWSSLSTVEAMLTYVLRVPGLRLLDTPAVRRRRPIVAHLWQIWLVFAAVAVGADLGVGRRGAMQTANNVMVH